MNGGFDSFEGSGSPIPGRVRIQSGPIAGPAGGTGTSGREAGLESVFEAREVSVYYGRKRALAAVNLRIPRNRITACATFRSD